MQGLELYLNFLNSIFRIIITDFVEHQGLLETHEDMNSGWTVLDIIKNTSTEYVRDIEIEKKNRRQN